MVKKLVTLVTLALVMLGISNCGSKGPLYLPPKPSSSNPRSNSTAASGVHANSSESANINQKINSSNAKITESLSITTSHMKAASSAL